MNHAHPMTRAQLREVDRRAMEMYGVPGVVLMENAGRNAARIIRKLHAELRQNDRAIPVTIVCGRGNNGGDGYVIARHLHNVGLPVELFLAAPIASLSGDAAVHARIVEKMKLPTHPFDSPESIKAHRGKLLQSGIIVDAILGTGFTGEIRPPLDVIIEAMNAAPRAIRVAIDVPSGLDCDTGAAANATVRAEHTITFVAPKIGFDAAGADEYTGRVVVADIGAPIELIRQVVESAERHP